MFLSGSMLDSMEKCEKQLPNISFSSEGKMKAIREILCAYYCMAYTVLSQLASEPDELPAEPNLWSLYTAKTFEELEILVAESGLGTLSNDLMTEGEGLYLNDKPTLAELAKKMPEYSWKVEAEKVVAMDDWFSAFIYKTQIRISVSLGLRNDTNPLLFDLVRQLVAIGFLESVKVFRQMRPVFVE